MDWYEKFKWEGRTWSWEEKIVLDEALKIYNFTIKEKYFRETMVDSPERPSGLTSEQNYQLRSWFIC